MGEINAFVEEERKAFTGLCIIKQLRKLIRVGGGMCKSHS